MNDNIKAQNSFLSTRTKSMSPISSKKSSTKISEIQLASGNQNGNNATDDKRRKVAPIIIKTKKDSYGHDIIREKTNKTTNVTWGTLAFSIQDTKRGKDSSFKMKKKIGHHRNISYSEKLLVQMDENEEDDDDGDRFDHNPELEENFGVRTRFNRTITNSKGEVKKIPLVLLSDSGLKQKWDVFIMVLLAWVSIVTPVQISYLSDFQRLDNIPDWMFLFLIDRLIDIVFVMDMFVSVRTSWLDEHGDEAFQDGKAVTRYLKGFFLIDFLSIFPFQVLLSSPGKLTRLLKLIRLVKMVRLLKVSKFYGAVEKQAGLSIGYSNIRMVILLLMILIIAHWMACALFIVYSYAEESGETTWVEAHGSIDSESSRIDMYLVAYYWAIMTLTTIGYGDVTAQNNGERVFFIIAMLLAAGVFSYLLGTFVSLIDSHYTEVFAFQEWIDSLVVFLKDPHFRLKPEFQKQVIEYVYHCQYETSQYKDLTVIDNLSPAMKMKIMFAYHGQRLHRLPYLNHAPSAFIARLAQRLQVLTEAAEQWIMRAGFIGRKMYVLVEGVAYVAEEAVTPKGGMEDDEYDVTNHIGKKRSSPDGHSRHRTMDQILTKRTRRKSIIVKETIPNVIDEKPKWEELRAHGLLIEKVSTIGYESMLFPRRRRHVGVKTYSICQMYTLSYKAFQEELSDYPEFSVQLRSQMMKGLWKTYMRKPRFLYNLKHFHDEDTLQQLESSEFNSIYNRLIDSRISRILAGVNLKHVKEKLILHANSKKMHEDEHQYISGIDREKILEDLQFASIFHNMKAASRNGGNNKPSSDD